VTKKNHGEGHGHAHAEKHNQAQAGMFLGGGTGGRSHGLHSFDTWALALVENPAGDPRWDQAQLTQNIAKQHAMSFGSADQPH
jgi:hypothetical protein